VNATVELAHQVLALEAIARPEVGTTVTPTLASAGTAANTVPAEAEVRVDVRAADPDEQQRVHRHLMALKPKVPGARLCLEGGPNRPPLPPSASARLFARARRVATDLGLEPVKGTAVGGGSDGNFTAGLGVPTLDGLGAVGGGAHAEGEYVELGAMIERTTLLAGLVDDLLEDAVS
jgi:glutamate carboxypeptidase